MAFKYDFIKRFFICFLLFSFLFTQSALALSAAELAQRLRNFIDNVIRVGIILAFFGLVLGGFLYLTSAGNIEQINRAKSYIRGSFLGILLLLTGWLALRNIRPEFTSLSPINPEIIARAPETLRKIVGAYLPSAEIPIETYLKGKEDGKSFLLDLDQIKEIQKIFEEELLPTIDNIINSANEILNLMQQCNCYNNSSPKGGERICEKRERKVEKNGEEEIEEYCVEVACYSEKCIGDPCANVRNKMVQTIQNNINYIIQAIEIREKLEEKIVSVIEPIAKFYYALNGIKQCPEYLAYKREDFSQLKDFLQHSAPNLEWVITRVPFLEEIENLRKWSFADFYCPKTGTIPFLPKPEELEKLEEGVRKTLEMAQINPKEQAELNRLEEELRKSLEKLGPEYEFALSCPVSVPFGETIERILRVVSQLRDNIIAVTNVTKDLAYELDEMHRLTSQCSPENCEHPCECGDPPGCPCQCWCEGNGCPLAEALAKKAWMENLAFYLEETVKANAELIKKIEAWLENWEKIEKRVRQRATPLTLKEIENIYNEFPASTHEIVAFEIMAARMHYCFAQPKEVEAGWSLMSCQTCFGSLNPDGKIFEKDEECKCNANEECKKAFPILKEYSCRYFEKPNLPDWLVALLDLIGIHLHGSCYNFNFYCCRQK